MDSKQILSDRKQPNPKPAPQPVSYVSDRKGLPFPTDFRYHCDDLIRTNTGLPDPLMVAAAHICAFFVHADDPVQDKLAVFAPVQWKVIFLERTGDGA